MDGDAPVKTLPKRKRNKVKCAVCRRTVRVLTHIKVKCDVCSAVCHYKCYLDHTCKSDEELRLHYAAKREKEMEASRKAAMKALLHNSAPSGQCF